MTAVADTSSDCNRPKDGVYDDGASAIDRQFGI